MNRLHPSLVALVLAGTLAHAQTPVARFDLGQSTEAGWELITTSSLSATQNGVTLTAAGSGLGSRTRGGIATNVAEDFIFNNNLITFTFTGLAPNQAYEFLTYAYDNTGGGSEDAKWYMGSVAPENFQHEWLNNADSIDPFTLTGTTDGSGSLTILVDGEGTSNNRANGFEVVLVPGDAQPRITDFPTSPETAAPR